MEQGAVRMQYLKWRDIVSKAKSRYGVAVSAPAW
jgi:hypothetical protein